MIPRIPKRIAPAISRLHDSLFCRPENVRAQARAGKKLAIRPDGISVAIAHYNRGSRAWLPLCNLLSSDLIAEVVFFDDASRTEDYEALTNYVSSLGAGERVRVERREPNRGAQATKLDAVAACRKDWVLLLDSDNTIFPSFLSSLRRIRNRNRNAIYCSPFAFPHFSFEPFAGTELGWERCVELTRSGELRKIFIINDGNYFIHRDSYIEKLCGLRHLKSDVADVFVANYLWLSLGGVLSVLDSGSYHHRIDSSSFWMRTAEESRQRVIELFARFDAGKKWDSAFEASMMR